MNAPPLLYAYFLYDRRTFGIYQIRDDSPGNNYVFMNMCFIESHGMQIKKEDYKLVYVGELSGNMSLDDIFERFNIDRPEDFRRHSLSVSDIVVLNDGGKEKKLSIHERLEINKRIIQETQGKDKPERGADLSVRRV